MKDKFPVLFIVLGLFLLATLLSACQTQVPEENGTPVTQTEIEASPETTEDTDEDASDTVADTSSEMNYCVECHTDQDMLINTAAPVEEVEPESEGEG